MTPIPDHLQPHLDRELDEGESILWSQQPSFDVLWRESKKMLRRLNWVIAIASISCFAIGFYYRYLEQTAPTDEESVANVVFAMGTVGILIIPISWYFQKLADKRTARSTIYAITEKRAIVLSLSKNGNHHERDYRADELIHLARLEYPDGSGIISIESARGAGHSNQIAQRHQLQALENVLEVERLLRKQFGDA